MVKRSNESAKKLVQTDPEKLGRFAPMLQVDEPLSYEDYIKTNPPKAAPAPAVTSAVPAGALEEARRRGLIK